MKKSLFTLALAAITLAACAATPPQSHSAADAATWAEDAPLLELTMPDTLGVTRHLSEMIIPGHYTLIDFWASWCPPCRAEMPNLKALYAKYHSRGFDIIGVSFDNDRSRWVAAIRTLSGGLPWAHISDLRGWQSQGATVYNVRGIPHTLLVSPSGRIVATGLRGETLAQTLTKIFPEE